ncbi:MAG: ACP S-malonyltransferase [Archangium sp.]|nr:ACP S-malonyltransferase [Archangium sp.]
MKVAFLFPGQGARNVLAGAELARSLPDGAKLLALATTVDVEARGGRALERTEVLQPVLAAISLSIHRALLRAGVVPSVLLGHSLGEVPALAAAGVISDEAAVKLASLRGSLMAREAAKHPGGLVAFSSLEAATAALSPRERVGEGPSTSLGLNGLGQFRSRRADSRLHLQLAAINAPDEVVVSGPDEALAGIGGVRVPVSGAWHSDAMAGAVDEFRAALHALEVHDAKVPLIRNLDGALGHSLDALADQLTKPVHFTAALATAVAQGIDTIITVGPGAVLRGLVRKNLGTSVRVLTTENSSDFERTVQALV